MGFSKIILLGVLVFLVTAFTLVGTYLALPGITNNNAPLPFKPDQIVLSSSYLYKNLEPELGDRVVFDTFSQKNRLGFLIEIDDYSLIGKKLYTIAFAKDEVPEVVTRDNIKRKIYFPYVSKEAEEIALNSPIKIRPERSVPTSGYAGNYRQEVPEDIYHLKYEIEQELGDKKVVIATVAASSVKDQIMRRGDDLLYVTSAPEFYANALKMLNLKTGKVETIFEEKSNRKSVYLDQIINDEVYFGSSGYMTQNSVYVLPVNSSKSVKVSDSARGIKDIDGRYFLVDGEGDACWGQAKHTLFNPVTKDQKFVADSHYGCNFGEEFLDLTSNDRFLMASHSATQDDVRRPYGGYYTSLSEINLNGLVKKFLVPEGKMPEKVIYAKYLPKPNKVFFLNDFVLAYDLVTSEFKPIVKLPTMTKDEFGNGIYVFQIDEKNICVVSDNKPESYYLIELDKNTLTSSNKCKLSTPKDLSNEERVKENLKYLESLNLPSEFTIKSVYR